MPRVDMIQVPGNYDAQTSPMPATDDIGQPKKPKKKPKPKKQQRPVTTAPKATPKKPKTTGKVKPTSAVGAKKPGVKPKTSPQVPKSFPQNATAYNSKAQTEIDEMLDQSGTKFKLAAVHPKKNMLVYVYSDPDGGTGNYYQKFHPAQRKKLTREVKRLTKPKKPKAPKPGKHPVDPMGRTKATQANARTVTKKLKGWNATQGEHVERTAKRMLNDPDWKAYAEGPEPDWAEAFIFENADTWSDTSRDRSKEMHYLQLAMADEFNLPKESTAMLKSDVIAKLKKRKDYDVTNKAYRAYVRAQYAETQDFLKRKKVKSMPVARGFGVRSAKKAPVGTNYSGQLQTSTMTTQPVTSYSTDPEVAAEFASGKSRAFVAKQEAPASRIFGIYRTGIGTGVESEVVMIGGKDDAVDFISWKAGSTSAPVGPKAAVSRLFRK